MKKRVFGILFISIFLISFSIADVSLSELDDVYNLGDRIYISAYGIVGSEYGNLNIDMNCGNKSINLVKIPSKVFSFEEEQTYSLPYKILEEDDLEIENFTDIIGSCQVVSSISSQSASTKMFTISDEIEVSASLDKTVYNPGEGIKIEVSAVKANGEFFDGFVEISGGTSLSKAIIEGFMAETFFMPETIEAGSYILNVSAHDVGKNGILNHGETELSFEINQVPTSIVMSLSNDYINPGSELSIGSGIFDQSGKEVSGMVSLKITSPELRDNFLNVNTGDFTSFEFAENATPGKWIILASYEDIFEEREVEVLSVQKVKFEINGSILTIENIGNSPYNKTIELSIGNESNELELNIKVGEIRKFNLNAPEGEYEVTVGDGENSINQMVLLTGNVISIKDFKNGAGISRYYLLWGFLIFILAAVSLILLKRYRRTRTLSLGNGKIKDKIKNCGQMVGMFKNKIFSRTKKTKFNVEKKAEKDFTNLVDLKKEKKIGGAESSLVLKGEKQPSAVICIRIKNHSSLKTNAKDALINIVGENKNKGLVDWKGEYVFIVFPPISTKTYNNEILSSKVGFKILKSFEAYNKKFKDKIEFNIGIHSGEMISSKEDGKLKYTSIGNTVSLAKRISNLGEGGLFVSSDIRKKMMRDLKVVKDKEIGKIQIYEVKDIRNREADKAKLKDLLKRMEE